MDSAKYEQMRQDLIAANRRSTDLALALVKALGLPGWTTPEMDATADRVIAEFRSGSPTTTGGEPK